MSRAAELPTVPGQDDEPLYEVIHGEKVEKPPMGANETVMATTLCGMLITYVKAHRLGRIASETLFTLDDAAGLRRRPDLAFVSYARWPRERPIPRGEEAWDVVPDLPIEVVSPTNTADSVVAKVREYFEAGARRVWVVYPGERLVYDYESPRSNRVAGPGDAIEGGDVLPGLQLPVASLFEDVDGAPA